MADSEDSTTMEERSTPLLEEGEGETEDVEVAESTTNGSCVGARKRLRGIGRWYHSLLESRPLTTKSVTAFFILGGADLVGQAFQAVRGQVSGLDALRTLRFAIFGLVLQAPWNHYYYLALDGALPPTEYPWTRRTFVKVFIDQFIQAPVFTLLMFLFLGGLQGNGIHQIWEQIRQEYWHTMFANWKLWVPATIVNLGLVPPLYRVFYLNIVFFFWSIALSLILNPSS